MARAKRDRILKDVNGDINDHLMNHVHLTNCIHVKNHVHKNSPILANRALLRDLAVLQRSRPLRDPSASPPSWHSPSGIDLLLKRRERDVLVNGRRSVGLEYRRECRRMLERSLQVNDPPISKAAMGELRRHGVATGVSDGNNKVESQERRRVRREESSRMALGNDAKSVKSKGGYRKDRSQADQLEDIPPESDDAAFSCNNDRTQAQMGKTSKEVGANKRNHGNYMKREKRHRFRSARRNRPSIHTWPSETLHVMSVSCNSLAQEHDDQNITGVPRNGCGIPWNWSRIHHSGKSFLDMAGQSLSCGLSESSLKKKGICDTPVMSENPSSSAMSDREALPLLLDASGSQGSIDRASFRHDYSGELGIFADNLLKPEMDTDLASEGRSHEQCRLQRQHTGRHQYLTQKYIPRSFGDLVGQNLVVQALSNAIMKKKVGLLYVFYGPHGTGKTTCARIFAKALNCKSLERSKPCGFCDSCISFDTGKSPNVREIGPVSKIDLESVIELLDGTIVFHHRSKYGVFIFDECDTLSSECWSAILKVIDRVPRHIVFILVCSSLDVLPHVIISRCQKFFFNRLKDADIICTLQRIATNEDLEIDNDALKLIASRSDGSLRDAEMTLEHLSLLGQRISLCLVQELVGLISDEKLVDLLDSALSADTANTVKNLRDITESGVQPLALMSQLATFITDVLAGSYDSMRERSKRKFFEHQALSKEDMEKLRQALKSLSEAERQLRVSNNKMTWLTAALLQLAPDQQYGPPCSSAYTSLDHSPVSLNNSGLRVKTRTRNAETRISQAGNSGGVHFNNKSKDISNEGNGYVGRGVVSEQVDSAENDIFQMNNVQLPRKSNHGIEEIWLEVLEKISIKSLKEFMYQDGKLISLSYGAAPTVQLQFSPQLKKSEVERFGSDILQAFESVLGSHVSIEIRHGSRDDNGAQPIVIQAGSTPSDSDVYIGRLQTGDTQSGEVNTSEIIEVEESPSEHKCSKCKNSKAAVMSSRQGTFGTNPKTCFRDQRELSERSQSLSLVRSKVSLAHVIQHAEGCSRYSGRSKREAVSTAGMLELNNLRLESRSRRLLCWNPPRITRTELSSLRIRTRKPQITIMKYVCCGRCLSGRSSR